MKEPVRIQMIWTFSNIDPVAIDLGFAQIRWYGLAYVVGILLAFKVTTSFAEKYKNLVSAKLLDNYFIWAVIAVVLGGRLGYVLFYKPSYYLSNPMEILAINQGGMSFHGAMLVIYISGFIYCRKYKLNILSFADAFAVSAPIGLFFGRIANFINSELWGRPTDGSWGVIFPNAGNMPRHPSQLYEAGLEGLLLFMLLYLMVTRFDSFKFRGLTFGTFLMGYGISRIIVEGFREPDAFIGYLSHSTTMGQWLSVPMVVIGASLVRHATR